MNYFSHINLRPPEYKVSPLMCPDFSQQSIVWIVRLPAPVQSAGSKPRAAGLGLSMRVSTRGRASWGHMWDFTVWAKRGAVASPRSLERRGSKHQMSHQASCGSPQTLHYRTRGAWPVEQCVRVQIAPRPQQHLLLSVIFTTPILGVKRYLIVVLVAFP